jgi:hypothetical protein
VFLLPYISGANNVSQLSGHRPKVDIILTSMAS